MTRVKRPKVRMRQYWKVEGWDGGTLIYANEFTSSDYSVRQMSDLLRLLVARTGLTLDEIAEATGRRPVTDQHPSGRLDVHQQSRPLALMCGSNPHFGARTALQNS